MKGNGIETAELRDNLFKSTLSWHDTIPSGEACARSDIEPGCEPQQYLNHRDMQERRETNLTSLKLRNEQ